MDIRIQDAPKGNAFGGHVIIGREFYNPETRDYIFIEAHSDESESYFHVAFWVPSGNDGDHGFGGSLSHVLNRMMNYVPPAGFVEMAIPEEVYGDS